MMSCSHSWRSSGLWEAENITFTGLFSDSSDLRLQLLSLCLTQGYLVPLFQAQPSRRSSGSHPVHACFAFFFSLFSFFSLSLEELPCRDIAPLLWNTRHLQKSDLVGPPRSVQSRNLAADNSFERPGRLRSSGQGRVFYIWD